MAHFSLTREQILSGLARLGELAHNDDKEIELAVYGGSAIVLCFGFRDSTADVDAVVTENGAYVRSLTAKVAAENGWPEDWLNDGVKGFLSSKQDLQELRPRDQDMRGLRLFAPTAEYLLAMKCMAMRIGLPDEETDEQDIKALMRESGKTTSEQVKDIVQAYYPRGRIPARVAFGIEQIADELSYENRNKIGHAPHVPR